MSLEITIGVLWTSATTTEQAAGQHSAETSRVTLYEKGSTTMDTTTGMLIAKIINPARTQREIAAFYADALREYLGAASNEQCAIDWKDINAHIINRWSLSGLRHIKQQAWKIVEGG